MRSVLLGIKRVLRWPPSIVVEVLGIAVAGVAYTVVPQVTERAASRRFAIDHPLLSRAGTALALDRVLHSPWFLALVLLAAASLGIVLLEQWRCAAREWGRPLREETFRSAAYRREVERSTRPEGRVAFARFRTTGRIGLLGSPLFHLGLMVLLLAATVRAAFSADGVVRLYEGEILPPSALAYAWRSSGWFAPAFSLASPLRLERVEPQHYASGDLRQVSALVSLIADGAGRPARVAVNEPLRLGRDTFYIASMNGPAVLYELRAASSVERRALILDAAGADAFEGFEVLLGGYEVRLRARPPAPGMVPRVVEARLVRRGALLYVGGLAVGQEATAGDGTRLRIHDVRRWAEFHGTRDLSAPLAYAGFVLAILGAVLIFAVSRIDTAVIAHPTPSGQRILIALRVQRFAPLHAERFERLVARCERGDME